MSSDPLVEYEVTDGAALLRLNRPEKKNALSEALVAELTDAVKAAEATEEVRAVVITGNGDAFSSGYDLSESGGTSEDGSPTVEDGLARQQRVLPLFTAIHELTVPVIAAVNGAALAGGSDLALTCDITLGSDRATFGYPGVRMGGMSLSLIYPFVIGIKHARELLYTGKTIGAEEAERIGMVNRIVSHDVLIDEALEEVAAIKKTPSATVQITKHMLNDVVEMQGYRPAVRNSGYLATLSHQTGPGQKFFEIRDEEGVGAAINWMNETDKP
ncbi:enoyl-CoA hydratase/isomerase family protein [Halorubrum sp. SD626R]|uniref:enoyl-CoA hydratase/isomerase family protein n=1 Tax=Halorubrum TaxID=56688 RepID=UPI0010F70B9C|nr:MULTISPECIES: enoyl-CoA hydratase/isomerase family protein [Halorubrum]TKX78122.1 enoyl-CoA hydratase/isomerase family protein [Halorubrum sp. SD626R]